MKKRFLSALCAALLLSAVPASAALAEPAPVFSVQTAPGNQPLTLDQAKELALANNPEVALAKNEFAKTQIAKRQYDRMMDKLEKAEDMLDNPMMPIDADTKDKIEEALHPSTLTESQKKEILKHQMEIALELAQMKIDYTEKKVSFAVEQAFYNVLKTQALRDIAEENVKRAEIQFKNANAAWEVGTVAHNDVLAAEVGLENAKAGLTSAKKYLALAQMAFNQALGRDLETPVVLQGEFAREELPAVDLKAKIDEVFKTSLAYRNLEEALAMAEINFTQAKKFLTPNMWDYKKAECDYQQAVLNFTQAKTGIEMAVRAAYLSMNEAYTKISLYEKTKQQAADSLRIAELRYQAGLATSLEVNGAQIMFHQAQTNYVNALFDYNLARLQFENPDLVLMSAGGNSGVGNQPVAGGMAQK